MASSEERVVMAVLLKHRLRAGRQLRAKVGQLSGAHQLGDDMRGGQTRLLETLLGVVGQFVGDLWPRQALAVGERLTLLHPVQRIIEIFLHLLDQEAQTELAGQHAVERLHQRLAGQRQLFGVSAAIVGAVDEIADRLIRIIRRPVPALVADLDVPGGTLAAERAIAHILDPRGGQ